MSSECVTLMVETVLSPSSLSNIDLWEIHWTTETASKMKLLENNITLASLKFMNCFGLDLAVPHVAEALHKNKSLRTLGIPSKYSPKKVTPRPVTIYENPYGENDIDVKSLSEMLKVNKTLKKLETHTIKLTRDDVYTLNDALQDNKTLKHLVLHPKVVKVIDPRIRS